ncbi:MAG: type II toxin-antitoxin system RelE/ParE family toxin [Spirochaetales bacterium]|nr:type II toxin-antitoxin system RelE/ParE family toxin [Spirochaetales bacterium]
MRIDFDPLALLELNDAVEYYNFQHQGLGDRFKKDVKYGLKKISDHPNAWQSQTSRSRRFVLSSFPYKIVYAIKEDQIIILAIANSLRKPEYWIDRE